MTTIDDIQSTVGRVAERVAPSVVRIGRHGGRGCGVVVGDGLVLTNAHNLRGVTTLVTFADGRVAAEQSAGCRRRLRSGGAVGGYGRRPGPGVGRR